jgi:hypothetical protein
MKFLENDGEEIEYSDLLKFGKLWFRLKRDEAMMIWRLGMEWYTEMRNPSVGQRFGPSLEMRFCS